MIEIESFVFEHRATSNRTNIFKIAFWFSLFILLLVTFCAIFLLFQHLNSKNINFGTENKFNFSITIGAPLDLKPIINQTLSSTTKKPDWWNPV